MELRPIKRNVVTVGNAQGIVIPKEVITLLGIESGDQIVIQIKDIIRKETNTTQIVSQQPSLLGSKAGSLRGGKPSSTTDEDGGTIQSHTQYMKQQCFINTVDPQGQLAAALGTRFYEPAEVEE